MPQPCQVRTRPLQRHEVIRIGGSAVAAALALVYLLVDWSDDTPNIVARLVGSAALGSTLVFIDQARQRRRLDGRLDRLEARLSEDDRATYWRAYADALADLGGIDGETSGDFPARRR